MFYDYQPILSYNAFLNVIIGERGVGKSYGAKKLVINDYLKNDNQFIYLRRYQTELDTAVPEFFKDIIEGEEFKDYLLTAKKSKKMSVLYLQRKIVDEKGEELWGEKEEIGYAIPLSTSNILKSTPFPKVRTIIFDEFLLTKGSYHYLRNEITQFLDFIETVGRLRDNLRVFMLANASDAYNPYMSYFDLELPYNSDFRAFKDGLIVVNYIKNENYRKRKKKSKFGQLISGTDYEKYAIENQWLGRANNDFIKKKGGTARNIFIFYVDKERYGVWQDVREQKMYISHDYDPNSQRTFAFDIVSHAPDIEFAPIKKSLWWIAVENAWMKGFLYYESIEIKEKMLDLFSKLV